MTDLYKVKNYFWQGENVRLRPYKPEDWELKYQETMDTDARTYLEWGVELPRSAEAYKKAIEESCDFKDAEKDNMLCFAIETIDGEFVGWTNLLGKDEKNGTFSVSVGIFAPHRQKGYAAEAIRIVLRYGFHELRLQKCNSGCMHTNEGSIKLHKKLGFVEEGKRRRIIYTNGQYYDYLLFGLTREEFDQTYNL